MTEDRAPSPPTRAEGAAIIREYRAMQTTVLDRSSTAAARQQAVQQAFAFCGNYGLIAAAATVAGRWLQAHAALVTAGASGPETIFPTEDLLRMSGDAPADVATPSMQLVEALIANPRANVDHHVQTLMRGDSAGFVAFMLLNVWSVLLADMVVDFDKDIADRAAVLQREALDSEAGWVGRI